MLSPFSLKTGGEEISPHPGFIRLRPQIGKWLWQARSSPCAHWLCPVWILQKEWNSLNKEGELRLPKCYMLVPTIVSAFLVPRLILPSHKRMFVHIFNFIFYFVAFWVMLMQLNVCKWICDPPAGYSMCKSLWAILLTICLPASLFCNPFVTLPKLFFQIPLLHFLIVFKLLYYILLVKHFWSLCYHFFIPLL